MKLQPQNGFVMKSFFGDLRDKELMRIIPFLVFLSELDDVRTVKSWFKQFNENPEIEYKDRMGEYKVLKRNEFIEFIVNQLELDLTCEIDSALSRHSSRSKEQTAIDTEEERRKALE